MNTGTVRSLFSNSPTGDCVIGRMRVCTEITNDFVCSTSLILRQEVLPSVVVVRLCVPYSVFVWLLTCFGAEYLESGCKSCFSFKCASVQGIATNGNG